MPTLITTGSAAARAFGFGAGQGSGFTPVTHIYTVAGSGTEIIPTGAHQLVIEVWGGGGGGQAAPLSVDGGGAGAGGYSLISLPLASSDWGKSLSYAVGAGGMVANAPTAGGASTVTNATFSTGVSMVANGGSGGNRLSAAPGGTASGGSTNTTGQPGTTDTASGSPMTGIVGSFGGGGLGAVAHLSSAQPGGGGAVAFEYT